MSIKIKQSILRNLEAIREKTFTETNIKELLIDVRERIHGLPILKDICDFIAHPTRDKGICSNDVELFYIKMKNVFISNAGATKFDMKKIDKRVFEILFEHGLQKFNEEILLEKAGLTKKDFEYLRNYNYKKKGSWVLLKRSKEINKLLNGMNTLCGTLITQSVFSEEELIREFISGIELVVKSLNIEDSITGTLLDNREDIITCLMALLHNAHFKLYDGNIATCLLTASNDQLNNEEVSCLGLTFVIPFQISIEQGGGESRIMFPLLKSTIRALSYVDNLPKDPIVFLKEINTIRKDGILKLSE